MNNKTNAAVIIASVPDYPQMLTFKEEIAENRRAGNSSIVSRETSMRVLREGGVTDVLIGAAFGISHQRVGAILGPHTKPVPPEDPYPADMPAMLKAWRKRHALSQAAAARELGISWAAYCHWEQGAAGCSLPGLLAKYVRLYDWAVDIMHGAKRIA